MVWKQCFVQLWGCYLWNLDHAHGGLTMLCNAPHSSVIPLMLSEPPHVMLSKGWEKQGGCWDGRQGMGALSRILLAGPPTRQTTDTHSHTHTNKRTHTLSFGLCIRREVYPGKCLTWIWNTGWRHSADAASDYIELISWMTDQLYTFPLPLSKTNGSMNTYRSLEGFQIRVTAICCFWLIFFFCLLKLVSAFEFSTFDGD